MKTIDDLAVSGQRVLVQLDLNVPVTGTPIGPDGMYTTVWFGELTISF